MMPGDDFSDWNETRVIGNETDFLIRSLQKMLLILTVRIVKTLNF